jgi:hypothetical protein
MLDLAAGNPMVTRGTPALSDRSASAARSPRRDSVVPLKARAIRRLESAGEQLGIERDDAPYLAPDQHGRTDRDPVARSPMLNIPVREPKSDERRHPRLLSAQYLGATRDECRSGRRRAVV